jgi:hypothetical protein
MSSLRSCIPELLSNWKYVNINKVRSSLNPDFSAWNFAFWSWLQYRLSWLRHNYSYTIPDGEYFKNCSIGATPHFCRIQPIFIFPFHSTRNNVICRYSFIREPTIHPYIVYQGFEQTYHIWNTNQISPVKSADTDKQELRTVYNGGTIPKRDTWCPWRLQVMKESVSRYIRRLGSH